MAILTLLPTGCGKKQPDTLPADAGPPPQQGSAAVAGPESVAPPAPAPRAATAPVADVPVDLDALTQALRRFSAEKRRVPASLNEVVAAGYIKALPPAPPGKKFAINPQRVEVILVKQ